LADAKKHTTHRNRALRRLRRLPYVVAGAAAAALAAAGVARQKRAAGFGSGRTAASQPPAPEIPKEPPAADPAQPPDMVETLQASAATAGARPAAETDTAVAPPATTVAIDLWHGYFEWRFMARVRDPDGRMRTVAESPGFRRWHHTNETAPTDKQRAAHRELLAKLERLGWHVAAAGEVWYQPVITDKHELRASPA
jgi:hypothetical protein